MMEPFGMGWGMWFFPLCVIVGIFLLVYFTNKNNSSADSPLDILKKRYAKGEISKEQFEQMKKDLIQ